MAHHYILLGFFLFRIPLSEVTERNATKLLHILEGSQIWKGCTQFVAPFPERGPKSCRFSDDFTMTIFAKTSYWQIEKINCEGFTTFSQNLVNFDRLTAEIKWRIFTHLLQERGAPQTAYFRVVLGRYREFSTNISGRKQIIDKRKTICKYEGFPIPSKSGELWPKRLRLSG